MSSLSDIRQTIAGLLNGTVTVHPDVPEKINPPIVLITKDAPYIQSIQEAGAVGTFGNTYVVNLILLVIFGKGEISKLDNDADQMIVDIMSVLGDITEVSPLVEIEVGELVFTGFAMRLSTQIKL